MSEWLLRLAALHSDNGFTNIPTTVFFILFFFLGIIATQLLPALGPCFNFKKITVVQLMHMHISLKAIKLDNCKISSTIAV